MKDLVENCAVNDCHKRELLWEIEELRAVVRDLLTSYLATFGGNKDELVHRAEGLLREGE